jgi:hypothetical protein
MAFLLMLLSCHEFRLHNDFAESLLKRGLSPLPLCVLDNEQLIVGAEIVGLTAATLLKRAGKTVAVIESREIVTAVTGHTTAEVTSLHQLIYAEFNQTNWRRKSATLCGI